MLKHLRAISLLVILGTTLLSGCAIQRSADIAAYEPHPSPIDNFQIVIPDGIYRSGQPKGEADWAYLKKIGITSVIKLNKFSDDVDEDEERQMAKKHGIEFIENYMQPEDWPHTWNLWASPNLESVMKAVTLLENRGHGKFLVHCAHGKDRTGLVIAVYSVRNKNFCKDTAYNEMKHYGHNSLLFGIKPVLYSPSIKENPSCNHE